MQIHVLRCVSFPQYTVLHSAHTALHLMQLQLFGCGSVAQVTTTQDKKGQYLSINLGFALGVTFGVFVSRGVSGKKKKKATSLLDFI